VLHLFAFIYCFFPLFLPIAPETDAAQETDYAAEDPAFAAEQPGKQTPLTHAYITYSFSLLLALEFATALFYPILLHSLFCNCYSIPAY
jgi:hypothetical protein